MGYYEAGNMPSTVDGDFLIVQQDKIAEVEGKMHGSYFTDSLTIRPYQDTSKLFLNTQVFQSFFPGRGPDFIGKAATPWPAFTVTDRYEVVVGGTDFH